MPVITLLSDLGNRDPYVAAVKGYLYRHAPGTNIVDISHEVQPFNIAEAAFILSGCYADFPAGSVHIIGVEPDTQMEARYILVHFNGHYFLTHDSGFIALVLPGESFDECFSLPFDSHDLNFPMKNILAPFACSILEGNSILNMGVKVTPLKKALLQPVLEDKIMRGTVIYVDNAGNAVTNISQKNFDRFSGYKKFKIHIHRNEYFDSIGKHYNEVPEGEKICFFNSRGLLEIAMNKANAAGLLGLHIGHGIFIEFS